MRSPSATCAELAAGMVTEVTTPPGTRWIPRGMTIEYLRKAESEVSATARLDKSEWAAAGNVAVPVSVADKNGNEVVRAVITMHVSPGKAVAARPRAAASGPDDDAAQDRGLNLPFQAPLRGRLAVRRHGAHLAAAILVRDETGVKVARAREGKAI
jgi:hypothetical protein